MLINQSSHRKRDVTYISRRGIQIVLGLLWFLDGALQLQPHMFTAGFANNVIAPAAQGQPFFVSGVMHLFISIFLWHPALSNAGIAICQMSLGIAILWPRTARYGLMASVAWGLFVWYVGEGFGGLASGQTLLLMGAPGAALIYALLALGSMPQRDKLKKQEANNDRPAYWLAIVWALLWITGAIYQLLPGQNNISALSSMLFGNASGAPGWMAALDTHVANFIQSIGTSATTMTGMHMTAHQMAEMQTHQDSGFWFIGLLAFVQLMVGAAVLIPGRICKLAVAGGIVLSLVFWVIGQSLGAYFTGYATDPNSAPLFVLLGVAVLGAEPLRLTYLKERSASLFDKLARVAT